MTKSAPLLLLCLASIVGCGSDEMPLAKISGTVTLDGAPVTGARILFRPESGPAASSDLDVSGHFELMTYKAGDGAVLGNHQVAIVPISAGVSLTPGQPPTAPTASQSTAVPARYHSFETSDLTAEVTQEGGELQFKLHGP